jgi:cysteinyl-tRNA synthetase
MDAVVAIRQDARGRKDFALSDQIRDKLASAGVNVNDTKSGATWEKK